MDAFELLIIIICSFIILLLIILSLALIIITKWNKEFESVLNEMHDTKDEELF